MNSIVLLCLYSIIKNFHDSNVETSAINISYIDKSWINEDSWYSKLNSNDSIQNNLSLGKLGGSNELSN